MDLHLSGRRALVTGGSKGIGLGVAVELAAEGAHVAICARNAAEVEAAADRLRSGGGTVHAQVADVTDASQVTDLVRSTADALGGLDILVNNAGAAHPGNFESLSDESWQGDLDVKLFSQIRCTRAALPHLCKSSAPRVININSVYARYPDPAFFATTVNRAACLSLSKALARELGPEGILVNSVNIGFVVTPQWENIRARRAPEKSPDEFFAMLTADEVPLGRFGTVEEVSGVVAFLASDRASYLTGTSIDVAGGMQVRLMCRLLAWAGRDPLSVADALGADDLAAFRALSRQHADGWGIAWWPPEGAAAPLTERSTRCAADDPQFAEVARTAQTDAGFVHLRWATPGLPVVTANTHPFTRGPLAFAHNGAIHPQGRLDEILPAGFASEMHGTTDSERYFLAVAARIESGESVHDAVAAVVRDIFERFEPTSLNAMLLTPDALHVISAHDPSRVPAIAGSSASGPDSSELDSVFYDLQHRARADSFVVASPGFDQPRDEEWAPLGNMKLLRIERGTLATTVSSLVESTVSLPY